MRIVRVEVWHFRGLEHYVLDDLAPDLNLVVGPNEAGKTTLFLALKYALFERYKGEGEDKRALKSWGGTDSPRVAVTFEVGGVRYSLTKQWLKGCGARLEGGGSVLLDDDAEARLRELWGTQVDGKRKCSDDQRGIWPLLWVGQGRAGVAPHDDLHAAARDRLRDTLATQVSELAAGEKGQRILARIESERSKWFTVTGKESTELARLRRDAAAAGAAAHDAKRRLDDAHALADALDGARRALAEIEPRLHAQRTAVDGAERALDTAQRRASAIETQRAERDHRLEAKRRAERDLAELDALAVERDQVASASQAAEAALLALAERRAACKVAEDAARASLLAAQHREREAADLRARALRQQERAQARERLARSREALRVARDDASIDADLARRLRDLPVGPGEIRALRAAQARHDKAQSALHAASVHLTLRTLRDLVVDGRKVAAGEELRWACDDETTVNVEGTLRFDVSPGGAELPRLRDEALQAERELGAGLAAARVASLVEAEAAFDLRRQLEAQRDERKAIAARVAPRGLDALDRDVRDLDDALAQLGDDDPQAPTPFEAEGAFSQARDAVAEAQAMRDLRADDARAVLEEHSRAEQTLTHTKERGRLVQSKLECSRPRAQLHAALEAASRQWSAAEDRLVALEAEHRSSGGLVVQQDVERERRALERLTAERARLHDDTVALAAKLSLEGALGTLDDLQVAEEESERAAHELTRGERAAAAIRALSDAMRDARRETEQRLVAPVIERIAPYLEGIFSGSQLRIDADWQVAGLRTGNLDEPLAELSGGAREQIGILVRLGLAEVLGQGEGLPIVLDDSLAYTDPERHAEMLRVLFRASKHQQIIVLSCHAPAFDRLGEARRYELPSPSRRRSSGPG